MAARTADRSPADRGEWRAAPSRRRSRRPKRHDRPSDSTVNIEVNGAGVRPYHVPASGVLTMGRAAVVVMDVVRCVGEFLLDEDLRPP